MLRSCLTGQGLIGMGIDILQVDSGTIIAPAGCGKTHLIAEALSRYQGSKPILILTHTNSGVAALRKRLNQLNVSSSMYRLMTIDGWAIKLLSLFPKRGKIDSDILALKNPNADYSRIKEAAWHLLKGRHIQDILRASYERLIVDEYQDCTIAQHRIIFRASEILQTCVLGDPMQAISGWPGNDLADNLADWDKHVCKHFPIAGELETPHRWIKAGAKDFGYWLLNVRQRLMRGEQIDLTDSPQEVNWINLDGTEDQDRQIRAGNTQAITNNGGVLIIGKSTSPRSQQEFASQIPSAKTVESVELRDMLSFAKDFDFQATDACQKLITFASSFMTNVRNLEMEDASRRFNSKRTAEAAITLLSDIRQQSTVRVYRPDVFRACIAALKSCNCINDLNFYEAAIQAREQNRLLGRTLPNRAVGSTLLLKGLEAEVSVILDATEMNAQNLYVAMTRGSKQLVICSRDKLLPNVRRKNP